MKTIETIFNCIMQSDVFRLNGPEIDLPEALIKLGNAVHLSTDGIDWGLGYSGECDLGSLIVGAYWSLSEWHAGQSSPSYAALCALGMVFSPGCSSGPDEESSEFFAYESIGQWFEAKGGRL